MSIEVEKQIHAALVRLEDTVSALPTLNPKPSLLPLFEEIEGLTRQLGRGSDPNLLHYLHKKSYQKARIYLEGKDPEAGTCSH